MLAPSSASRKDAHTSGRRTGTGGQKDSSPLTLGPVCHQGAGAGFRLTWSSASHGSQEASGLDSARWVGPSSLLPPPSVLNLALRSITRELLKHGTSREEAAACTVKRIPSLSGDRWETLP